MDKAKYTFCSTNKIVDPLTFIFLTIINISLAIIGGSFLNED